jgi:hypothetical protein
VQPYCWGQVVPLCYTPKLMGSRPNEVNEVINLFNPSGGTSPWVTQPVAEMSPRGRNKKGSCGVELDRCIRPTTSSPSVSRLSIQCGVFNISQFYRPPRSVTGLALLIYVCIYIVTCSTEGRRYYATVVERFHGYAHHSVLSRCMVTNSE